MRNLVYILLGGALVLMTGCHEATKEAASAPVAQPEALAGSIASAAEAVGPPCTGFRRYRGTVGGQPVTLELTIETRHDSAVCAGSYTYDRHPAGLLLLRGSQPWRPGLPLQLAEADSARPQVATGRWQATQPVGPALSGTWRSPAGKELFFSLHEDYTDAYGRQAAVRYEVLTEAIALPC